MKNTVQKYLFYPEQQNTRLKKYALQHTLTTKAKYSMWLTNYILKYKKMRLSQINFEMAFFVSAKNRASPNFAQSELARLPKFLYLNVSSK